MTSYVTFGRGKHLACLRVGRPSPGSALDDGCARDAADLGAVSPLRVRGCDPALVVYADAEKMRQIVLNLLANAIKYTASGGNIRVSTDEDSDNVLIRVRDSGRGIASDKLEQIFAPFVRIDTGYARSTEARASAWRSVGISRGRWVAISRQPASWVKARRLRCGFRSARRSGALRRPHDPIFRGRELKNPKSN